MKTLTTALSLAALVLLSGCVTTAPKVDETTGKTANYVSTDGRVIRGMSVFYEGMQNQFGSAVPKVITVKFLQDHEVPSLQARQFDSSKDRVMVLTLPGRDVAPCAAVGASTLLVVSHLYLGNKAPAEVGFLNYGFAIVKESENCTDFTFKINPDRFYKTYWGRAKQALSQGPLTLDMLKKGTVSDKVSPAFALWLSATIPSEQLVALIKSTAVHGNVDEAFKEVLNKDSATVEKEWIEFMSK